MFLGLLALAVAVFALMNGSAMSDRIHRLESDRADANAQLALLQRLVDQLRKQAAASPRPADPEIAATAARVVLPRPHPRSNRGPNRGTNRGTIQRSK